MLEEPRYTKGERTRQQTGGSATIERDGRLMLLAAAEGYDRALAEVVRELRVDGTVRGRLVGR